MGLDANAKPNAIVLLKLVMNVVTLLAMTFAIAFIAPVARYVHQKWFVECWHSTTAAVVRGKEKTKDIVAASAEKDFNPRTYVASRSNDV